jgi:glycerate kinase
MLHMLCFADRLAGARLVVTGEGSLDAQTLRGKAPAGVARAAASARAGPVVAVAGRCMLSLAQLRDAGIEACYALADTEPDPDRRMAHAGPLVEEAARRLAVDWLPASVQDEATGAGPEL